MTKHTHASKIRVMLADDHDVFRRLIAKDLQKESDLIAIIGEAPNGLVLLQLMEENIPDVVLLDLEMPVLDGHKTLGIIKERFPTVKIIILSVHYHEYYIAQLLILGASSYLSKTALISDIIKTVNRVHEDGFYFGEMISRKIFISLLDSEKLGYLISERVLKDREIQVLKEICNGKTYKEAAEELNVSLDTIKFYIKSIYKKTQIKSVAGLVKYAIKVGITSVS